jgi:hypothetical protein
LVWPTSCKNLFSRRWKNLAIKATPDENGGITGWTADSKNILWSEANKTLNSIYVLSVDGKSISEWNKDQQIYLARLP